MKFNLPKPFLLFVLLTCFLAYTPEVSAVLAIKKTTDIEKSSKKTKRLKSAAKQLKIKQKKKRKRLQLKAKLGKILLKFKRKRAEKGPVIDFEDPVQKWLWFAIFLFAAALALAILLNILSLATFFGWIAGFLSFAALVSLIIWLVKYFG